MLEYTVYPWNNKYIVLMNREDPTVQAHTFKLGAGIMEDLQDFLVKNKAKLTNPNAPCLRPDQPITTVIKGTDNVETSPR